jgi:hypothetical protein
MRIRSTIGVALSFALAAATLHGAGVAAQSVLPEVGTHAAMFSLPEGGGAGFGIRKMRGPTTNVGLEVQFGASHRWASDEVESSEHTSWSLGLRPDVRLYRRTDGPVVPFLEWNGRLGYAGSSNDSWSLSTSLGVGLGVEWFPLDDMSVAGSSGVAGSYSKSSNPSSEGNESSFGAFRSELTLNLYF